MNQTPPPIQSDEQKSAGKDAALALLERARAALIDYAFKAACSICQQSGEVSSTAVWQVIYVQAEVDPNLKHWLTVADPRWMGAVFREGNGWKRVRWEASGSHKRPVAVWTRAGDTA